MQARVQSLNELFGTKYVTKMMGIEGVEETLAKVMPERVRKQFEKLK